MGTYQVSMNGRGTAALSFNDSLGFSNFTFYVVSVRELLFVQTYGQAHWQFDINPRASLTGSGFLRIDWATVEGGMLCQPSWEYIPINAPVSAYLAPPR